MRNLLIDELDGVGPVYGEKLRAAGIQTSQALLDAAATEEGRKRVAQQTDVPEKRLLGWVKMVDLCRIDGLQPFNAELLDRAGAGSVAELAAQDPEMLAERCAELGNGRAPTPRLVRNWVQEARELPRRLQY